MTSNLGHATAFIFVALPFFIGIISIIVVMFKAYQHQKALKAQSDALFKKLENR